jgi:multicomponent Na+:H+ antiporter subunit G
MLSGAAFMLISAIGLIRLPDIYSRMHAITKSPSLAIFLLLVAAIISFATIAVLVKAILIIIFIFLTVPVASHMIGRTANFMKIPKWNKTIADDLEKFRQLDQE